MVWKKMQHEMLDFQKNKWKSCQIKIKTKKKKPDKHYKEKDDQIFWTYSILGKVRCLTTTEKLKGKEGEIHLMRWSNAMC